jgi:hypothetical protein
LFGAKEKLPVITISVSYPSAAPDHFHNYRYLEYFRLSDVSQPQLSRELPDHAHDQLLHAEFHEDFRHDPRLPFG